MTRRNHQRAGFVDRSRGVRLIAKSFGELLFRRGELGERIDEAAKHHRSDILDDFHQHRLVENKVHGAAHPWIVEGFFLVVDPGCVNHALVVRGR